MDVVVGFLGHFDEAVSEVRQDSGQAVVRSAEEHRLHLEFECTGGRYDQYMEQQTHYCLSLTSKFCGRRSVLGAWSIRHSWSLEYLEQVSAVCV